MNNECEEKTKLCQLCFVSCDEDFVVVDDDKRNMLETVGIELGLSTSKEPIICKSCIEKVEKCFDFKSLCLDTEDCITSFSSEKNDDKVDMVKIYLNRNENKDKNNMPQDHTVCRLCLELVKYGSYISLNSDTKDKIFLNQFFPEVDLNVVHDPVICALCHISLQDYFDFMRRYLDEDITVEKLCTDEADCNNESKFNLKTELMVENTLKYENEGELEMGGKLYEYDMPHEIEPKPEYLLGTEDEEFFLKSEPVDNATEPTDSDSSPSSLSESITIQIIDNTYHCRLCAFKTDYKYNLQKHTEVHQKLYHKHKPEGVREPPTFECKKCPFKTEYRTSIRRHILRHKPPTYKCRFCEYKTITKYNLKHHLVTKHNFSKITEYHYNRYPKVQHREKEYSCKICPFKTVYRYKFTRHKLVHQDKSKVMMYSCEICEHKTKYKRNLNVHLLTHKDPIQASLHQCQICPFKTKYMRSLKRHMFSVHNEASEQQVYMCDLCEYETMCKDAHSSHRLSHRDSLDSTQYRCRDCQFMTIYKSSLKRHKLVYHNRSEVKQ